MHPKVSDNGERTMRTCLSAAAELQDPNQLPAGWASGSSLLHLEGYSLYRPQVAEAALRAARHKAATVILCTCLWHSLGHAYISSLCKGSLRGLHDGGACQDMVITCRGAGLHA